MGVLYNKNKPVGVLFGAGGVYKVEGEFVSASTSQGIVEVNVGFKPSLIIVTLPFSETNKTYAFSLLEDTDYSMYWSIPSERVVYDVKKTKETGICEITDNGFKFRSNAANTRGVTCKYVAVK